MLIIAKLHIYREDRWTNKDQPYKGQVSLVSEDGGEIEFKLSQKQAEMIVHDALEAVTGASWAISQELKSNIALHYPPAIENKPASEEEPLS